MRVPGIKSVRVTGDDTPSEIHIVATHERSPKQLVRDVQSLASAGFGMPIDHRIVSVVQLEDQLDPIRIVSSENGRSSHRPELERVIFASKAGRAWIKVIIKWPDGTMTEGVSTAEGPRQARARSAVDAVLRAVRPFVDKKQASITIPYVILNQVGPEESVVVQGSYIENGTQMPVVGSAVVHDDISTASVHAVLHALNRKLS